MVVNHFKSKSCRGRHRAGNADTGDGQGAFNGDRERQADGAGDVRQRRSRRHASTSAIFLAGDFNSYTHEDPMQVLYGAGLHRTSSPTPRASTTYSFGGLSGSLDHVLANARGPGRR